MQGKPVRQLNAAIQDMVLRELALQLAHLNNSQGLAAFDLPMPTAQLVSAVVANEIARYDVATQAAMRDEHVPQLNPEQRAVYDNVMAAVDRRAFFVNGLGDTSKTFLYSCLLSTVLTGSSRYCCGIIWHCCITAGWRLHCTLTFQDPYARPQQHVHMLH